MMYNCRGNFFLTPFIRGVATVKGGQIKWLISG